MAQQAIEIILARQLASSLSAPMLIIDQQGDLLFYNDAAELILGADFEEALAMPLAEWMAAFKIFDEHGKPVSPDSLPFAATLSHGQPAHGAFLLGDQSASQRHIQFTAIPLMGQADRFLGAIGVFWEVEG